MASSNNIEDKDKLISLSNLKLIWDMITEAFARKDYVKYLESRIEALEKASTLNRNV